MPTNRSRTYHVVAMSFPIVYSLEGDHDPNGMLCTLHVHEPLLRWVEEQRRRNGDYLTRVHRRIQLMETVVYAVPRFLEMRRILSEGPPRNRYLLRELGDESEVLDREDRGARGPRLAPHDRAMRQNYRATVDELVSALRELTGGRISTLRPKPPEIPGRQTVDERVLRRILGGWRTSWEAQLEEAERALEGQLEQIRRGWPELLTWYRQQRPGSQLTDQDIERLMFNDRSAGLIGDGEHAPAYNRCNPLRPIPLVRPLVLRACRGEQVRVRFENGIRGREVGLHVQGDGLGGTVPGRGTGTGVRYGDGACVGDNDPTTVPYRGQMTYRWTCAREGVWPINDLGDIRGTDRGTNNHGLFAALVVEPEGARWYDPQTGKRLDGTDHADGLYVDVVPRQEHELKDGRTAAPRRDCPDARHEDCRPGNRCRRWREESFVDFHHAQEDPGRFAGSCSHREFTVFFHDEPETRSGIPHPLPHSAMPLSYRAEPMHNRLPYRLHRRLRRGEPRATPGANGIDHSAVQIRIDRKTLGEEFWVAKDREGRFLERVSGEEQHHSSWLFGEPVTPILRAYRGDPSRVRLVHAGVKETHVFHLHVHQWRAVAQDTAEPSVWEPDEHHGSQLLDSVSIGPQTAMTIDPLYGSGSRQHAVGDIIWHCHLYPHFHHGMWGLWRSFDRLVDGTRAYPDGTPCPELKPLPGRVPPSPEPARGGRPAKPGFPWFIDATYPRKSPPPPSPLESDAGRKVPVDGRRQLLRMGSCSEEERAAFAPGCRSGEQPGALFVDLDGLAHDWSTTAQVPERRIIHYDLAMAERGMVYNSAGWYDPHGHHYRLEGITVTRLKDDGSRDGDPVPFPHPVTEADGGVDAFFPRANHGDIVELRLTNTVGTVEGDHFDLPGHPVECGLHVHLVKFDVLAADGSATGWNYLSGASSPEAVPHDSVEDPPTNVSLHRWVVDEEFGPCFFHDHLLANFRQKRGLFAALIAEPNGTRWYLPDQQSPAWVGSQAVVVPRGPGPDGGSRTSALREPYREAGLALGDFVPLNRPQDDRPPRPIPHRPRADDDPLNEPDLLGGDDDPGVMGVNYRCAPLRYRGKDPSEWFSSSRSSAADPDEGREVLDAQAAHMSPPLPVPRKHPGDPDTPTIWTYPGERLRIRLLQGSHEEQHSFMLNGMRWRKDWHNRRSPWVDQQTLGISEAFTLDINPPEVDADGRRATTSPYGVGDHLWQFTVMDDLWLGCWGLIRSLQPNAENFRELPPLRRITRLAPAAKETRRRAAPPTELELAEVLDRHRRAQAAGFLPTRPLRRPGGGWSTGEVREYVVVAQRHEHQYAGGTLTDPWGLIYRTAEEAAIETRADGSETGNRRAVGVDASDQPLVLRAHPGEWIRVTLINELLLPQENHPGQDFATRDPHLPDFGPEVSPPRLPVEHRDHLGYPDRRTVSPRVSLHPSLLLYDVLSDDGAAVGLNHDSTVAPLDVEHEDTGHGGHDAGDAVVHRPDHGSGHRDANWREYWWYADPALAPDTHQDGPGRGRTCYLFDMGDIRNHRHHGLIGAVVIEPRDLTPVDPQDGGAPKWTGAHVHLRSDEGILAQELVLFLQDGLRHFLHGDIDQPLPDISPSDPPVDVGQKAISYRSPLTPWRDPLALPNPTAPILRARRDLPLWWRLVCAGDKPRNHTFTVHDVAWDVAPWVRKERGTSPDAGSITAISAGFTQDLIMIPEGRWDPGDHAYRSGSFRWAASQGMWGILRMDG